MHEPFDAGDLVVLVLGAIAALLLGTTLVLGLSGSTTASTWTGTAGGITLAMWLMAMGGNGRSRPKYPRRRQAGARR
jgi:hypothetical protein